VISEVTTPVVSSPAQVPGNPGGALGKDEFLKMLVAQLKNQDPMNPMNSDDMAAQLAQFSSLEQLTNISAAIESQASLQEGVIGSINDSAAMNMLGKTILAVGDQVEVPADGSGSVRFEVGGQGGLATLRIFDETGQEVGSRPLGFLNDGKHDFALGGAVAGLPAGAYRFAVDVVDAAGKPVPSQGLISTRIDGVQYGPEGPVLTSGEIEIPFGTIVQIEAD
jgi:flagellar basal-body rod modification protein FlgD